MGYPTSTQTLAGAIETKQPLADAERRLSRAVGRITEATARVHHHAEILFGPVPQPVDQESKTGGTAISYRIDDLERAVSGLENALSRFD